jgi:hypothetical protein
MRGYNNDTSTSRIWYWRFSQQCCWGSTLLGCGIVSMIMKWRHHNPSKCREPLIQQHIVTHQITFNYQVEFSFSDTYWQHSAEVQSNKWQILRTRCWGTVKQVTDTENTMLRYSQTSDRYWEHNAEVQSNKWQKLRTQCWGTVKQVTDTENTMLRYSQTSDRYWEHNAEVQSNKWQILRTRCWGTVKQVTDTENMMLRYSQTSDRYWQDNAEVQSNKW